MAPEYAKNGKFSTKSDAFSFGVLVMEIITGRKNSSFRNFSNLQSYVSMQNNKWEQYVKLTERMFLKVRLTWIEHLEIVI